MSAFIVADEHLNYLISFASDHDVSWWNGKSRNRVRGNEQLVFGMLHRANMDSVNFRYRENAPAMPSKFRWRPYANPIQVLKGCDCFDYQACEVDDYEQSEPAKIIDAIRVRAISVLPGYEQAAWEIREPLDHKVIRLSDLGKEGI